MRSLSAMGSAKRHQMAARAAGYDWPMHLSVQLGAKQHDLADTCKVSPAQAPKLVPPCAM